MLNDPKEGEIKIKNTKIKITVAYIRLFEENHLKEAVSASLWEAGTIWNKLWWTNKVKMKIIDWYMPSYSNNLKITTLYAESMCRDISKIIESYSSTSL